MSDEPKVPPDGPGAPAKPAPPATAGAGPPKPAAPTPKPVPPAPKPVVKPEPWSSPLVDELQKRFPGALSDAVLFRNQPSMTVAKESLIALSEYLKSHEGGAYTFLTDETAVDYPKRPKRFEIIYQLYSFKLNHRLRLKVLAAEGEKMPSVVRLWPAANWLEREVYDMFGIEYEGHPDLRRILLPDEWTGHPLRKDYDILKQDDASMAETTFLDASELVINMGPQHPATHGVLRVKLKLDGEKVVGSECIIGYLHRGVEKIAENRTYTQFAPYVDRMDYVAAVTNGMGYCEAVEKLLGVDLPPRAQYTRMILAELQRIASHLLWLGTHALDLGAMTPVFYTFREREEILKIFENYCGARLTTHAFRIGGLQYDLYDGFEKEVRKFCDYFLPKIDEYEELLTTNRIWMKRTSCSRPTASG